MIKIIRGLNSARYLLSSILSLLLSALITYLTFDSIHHLIAGGVSIDLSEGTTSLYASGGLSFWNSWLLSYSFVIPIGFQVLFLTHIFLGVFFHSMKVLKFIGISALFKNLSVSASSGAIIYLAPFLAAPLNSYLLKLRYSYGFLHFFRDDHSLLNKLGSQNAAANPGPKYLIASCGLLLLGKSLIVVGSTRYLLHYDVLILFPVLISFVIFNTWHSQNILSKGALTKNFLTVLCFAPTLFMRTPTDIVIIGIFAFSYHVIIWYLYFLQRKWPKNFAFLILFLILNTSLFLWADYLIDHGTLTLLAGEAGNLWGSSYFLKEPSATNLFYGLVFDARIYHFWAIFHVTQSWFKL